MKFFQRTSKGTYRLYSKKFRIFRCFCESLERSSLKESSDWRLLGASSLKVSEIQRSRLFCKYPSSSRICDRSQSVTESNYARLIIIQIISNGFISFSASSLERRRIRLNDETDKHVFEFRHLVESQFLTVALIGESSYDHR